MHCSFPYSYVYTVDLALPVDRDPWLWLWILTPRLHEHNYSELYSFFFPHCSRECYVRGIKTMLIKLKGKDYIGGKEQKKD